MKGQAVPDTEVPNRRRALLLIDFQRDFLADDGRMPVARNQVIPVLAATRAAIDRARCEGKLIVKIGNEFRRGDIIGNLARHHAAVACGPGTRWDPRADIDGAVYLAKWKADAFCNPELHRLLAGHRIEQVLLAGLYARACVTATGKGALARGLRVMVLADAVACRSDATREAALSRLERLGAELVYTGSAGLLPARD
jgi:nicotinamidase-related amidase